MQFDIAKKVDAALLREEQFFKSPQKTPFCCERKGAFFIAAYQAPALSRPQIKKTQS